MDEGLGKRRRAGALCALVVVCLCAAGAAVPMGAGAKVSDRLLTYAGSTSFGRPFVLQIRRGAITRMAIAWDASCVTSSAVSFGGILERSTGSPPDSIGPDSGFLFFGGRLSKFGGFSGTGLGTLTIGELDGPVTQTISGRVKGNRASGRWRVRIDVIDNETSTATDSCKTSTFNWTAARAPGRAYGGFTNQDDPVVVQLNSVRTSVAAFRIAWTANCTDETTVTSATTLTGLPLTARRFNATRTVNGTTGEDETPVTFNYEVEGSVAKQRATGTFNVTVTNPASPTATCTSPTIEWTVAST